MSEALPFVKPKKPLNYLSNKNILKEIHLSKNSFCYFTEPEYNQYDIIIDKPDLSMEDKLDFALSPEQIYQAKVNKAARLSIDADRKILPSEIEEENLIFRVMTWDHIPLLPKKIKKTEKPKTAREIFLFDEDEDELIDLDDSETDEIEDMVHEKVNFPPFQHFKLVDGQLILVGKSHWINGLENGEFSQIHGQVTRGLGKIYLLLCDRYGSKFNYRGYSYNEELKGAAILQLSMVGLRFNEAKSANPFAYFTTVTTNAFCRVLNAEKKNQRIRDDILESHGMTPSMTRQMSDPNAPKNKRYIRNTTMTVK